MNDRQRFNAAMHYQPRDRSPLYDFNFWNETLPHWHTQGLPTHVNRATAAKYFGMDYSIGSGGGDYHDVPVRPGMCPRFEVILIEDRGDHEIVQQYDGVHVLRKKVMSSIPHPVTHQLVDRTSWKKLYKPKLDPTNPERFPADWDDQVKIWTDPNRQYPLNINAGSLYGSLRDWMGLENLSMVLYDDPAWFEEMVTTLADCIIGTLTHVFETGAQFDACSMWEDMCYNAGPLLSPTHFKKYLVPHYERITELIRKHNIDVIWLDCDGKIDDLLPLWLKAGVNCMFPLEVGTWKTDPIKYRKEYGKDLLMMGGVSKLLLATDKKSIEKEVHRLAPLVEEGGFIGFADHRVPPDVPLQNYLHFLVSIREVWGKNTNLEPMPAEELIN